MPPQLMWPGDVGEDEPQLAHPKPVKRPRAQPQRLAAKGQSESSQLEDLADRLFYKLLLKRHNAICEAVGYPVNDEPLRVCWGRLDPAHGFKRRFHSVRWAHASVFLLCRKHHDYFEIRKGEWFAWRVSKIGPVLMEHVQRLAQTTWRGDIEEVIAGLRSGITQLERA